MKYFSSRQSKGFHHTYLYVDEYKNTVGRIEESARRVFGMENCLQIPSEGPRGKFPQWTQQKRQKCNHVQAVAFLNVFFPLIILLLVFICYCLIS